MASLDALSARQAIDWPVTQVDQVTPQLPERFQKITFADRWKHACKGIAHGAVKPRVGLIEKPA